MKTAQSFFTLALGLITSISAHPLASTASVSAIASTKSASISAAVASATANAPTLLPAVHWKYPVDDLHNLVPSKDSKLYYSHNGTSDPTVKHQFASVAATFQYESVVLDHSSSVESTTCTQDKVTVKFTSVEAHKYASDVWTAAKTFMLITYTEGCGSSIDQRTFFLVEEIQQSNGTSITAKIKTEVAVETAFSDADISWGTYHPSNSTTTSRSGKQKRISKTKSGSADINIAPANTDQSPFGPASLIVSGSGSVADTSADFQVFCVQCGVSGHVTIEGTASFGLSKGSRQLTIATTANIQAGFNLGLVANVATSKTVTKQLLTVPIPDLGISVTGLFAAGVFVELDASATLGINAAGQALMGVNMSLPDFSAQIDMLNTDASTVTGFHPQFTKTFNASGTISASAQFALPVSLNFGVDIKLLDIQKSVALIEQPSLVADVAFSNVANSSCPNALAVDLKAENDVSLNVLGKVFALNHLESPPLVSGCIPLGVSA